MPNCWVENDHTAFKNHHKQTNTLTHRQFDYRMYQSEYFISFLKLKKFKVCTKTLRRDYSCYVSFTLNKVNCVQIVIDLNWICYSIRYKFSKHHIKTQIFNSISNIENLTYNFHEFKHTQNKTEWEIYNREFTNKRYVVDNHSAV